MRGIRSKFDLKTVFALQKRKLRLHEQHNMLIL